MNKHSSVVSLSLDVKNAIMFAPKLAERIAIELCKEHGHHAYASTKTNTVRVNIGEAIYWVSEFSYIKPLSLEQDIIN